MRKRPSADGVIAKDEHTAGQDHPHKRERQEFHERPQTLLHVLEVRSLEFQAVTPSERVASDLCMTDRNDIDVLFTWHGAAHWTRLVWPHRSIFVNEELVFAGEGI